MHESWGNNLFIEREFRGGDIDAVARTAEIVVRRNYRMNRHVAVPLEGRAVLAYRDHRLDELVVYTSTQVPHIIRLGLSEVLDLEERCIRVIAPDVGGGFGSKARLSPEEATIAALALELDHPVRWIEDRGEHFLASTHTRDHEYRVTAYADKRGRVRGIDVELIVDGGAYAMWPNGPFLETGMAARNLPGPYDIRDYRVKTYTVATNKAPIGPYRGVGRPGACFAIERTIDEVARAVRRDPLEVRTENMVTSEQMPYTTIANLTFDNGDYPSAVKLCAETIDLPAVRARQAKGEPDGRLIGVRLCLLLGADRSRLRRMGEPRQPVHSGLRELHGFADARRHAGAAGRHPFARPRPRDHAVADRARGARHRPGEDLGPSRRHRRVAVRQRHHRVAQHRDGGRRGRPHQPALARQDP